MVAVTDRAKTLDEAKAYLRERLASHSNPFLLNDEATAGMAIDRLQSMDWDHWADVWGGMGAEYEQRAADAEARGDAQAAAAAHLQAYAFYLLGRFPSPTTPKKQACAVKKRASFLQAARWFDPPLERVVIPFAGRPDEGREVVVHVRRPKGVARPPVLVTHGGVDSYKEESNAQASRFLEAGYATVCMDMPGTGEAPVLGSPDGERLYTPIFEWVRAQPDLDGSRVALMGRSFGGYWAAKVAHTHRDYLAAVVCWGGGAHLVFQPDWTVQSRYADSYLSDLTESRGNSMGIHNFEEYKAFVPRLSLLDQGWLDQPCAPLLCVNGKGDTQTPIQDIYLMLEHGNPKSARVFPGGHMGNTPETLPTIMRWVGERLKPQA